MPAQRPIPTPILWRALVAVWVPLLAGCSSIAPPRGARETERTLTVTAYCSCPECCGWRRNWLWRPVYASGPRAGQRKTVGLTAAGTRARPGVISADTSVYPFGTVMYIPGYGYGRVEDRGGAIQGPERIEVYFRNHTAARAWGRQRASVRVWTPGAQ